MNKSGHHSCCVAGQMLAAEDSAGKYLPDDQSTNHTNQSVSSFADERLTNCHPDVDDEQFSSNANYSDAESRVKDNHGDRYCEREDSESEGRAGHSSCHEDLNMDCDIDQRMLFAGENLTNELNGLQDTQERTGGGGEAEELQGPGEKEYLAFSASDIGKMVRKMQTNDILDWEGDTVDPFEQVLAKNDPRNSSTTRPNSAQEACRVSQCQEEGEGEDGSQQEACMASQGQEQDEGQAKSQAWQEGLKQSGSLNEKYLRQKCEPHERQCPHDGGSGYDSRKDRGQDSRTGQEGGRLEMDTQHSQGRGQYRGGNNQQYSRDKGQAYLTRERNYLEGFKPSRGANSIGNLSDVRGSEIGGRKQFNSRGRGQAHFSQDRNYKEGFRGASSVGNLSDGGGRSGSGGGGVRPWLLVEALAEYPDFSASLLILVEWKGMQPGAVRETVAAHPHIFGLRSESVVLEPDLGLCVDHPGPRGCQNSSTCSALHICPTYVRNYCTDNGCVLGHRWFTNHNKAALRAYYMDCLHYISLRNLMRNQLAARPPSGQLDVCREYNGQGCTHQDCQNLHICLSFVTGVTKCGVPGCFLNHNILAPDCCSLLSAHGFSTNEAPRDVAVALLQACPALGAVSHLPAATTAQRLSRNCNTFAKIFGASQYTTSAPPQVQHATTFNKTSEGLLSIIKQKFMAGYSNNTTFGERASPNKNNVLPQTIGTKDTSGRKGGGRSQDGSSTSLRAERQSSNNSSGSMATEPVKRGKQQTVWSYYLYGDIEINEICYYSVEGMCRNESCGCQRLHSSHHFHWQVSEQGRKWLNLRPWQSTCLEQSFCDPGQDGSNLPCLDPAKLSQALGKLLTVIGRDTWQANFQAMVLSNSDQSRLLYLRRLCTEYLSNKQVKANMYSWFFCDKNNKWVKYGKVDSANETSLVSSLTSADIEKHYQQQQHVPLTFTNASFTYTLDFVTMTQTNQKTKMQRNIRRRPEPHLKADNSRGASGQANLR